MVIETGDRVRIEYVGRLDDGTVFDTSREAVAEPAGIADDGREYEPLEVEIGNGRIIEGLEDGLVGLDSGDEETITVSPEAGYGEWDEDRVVEYDREDLGEALQGADLEVGMRLQTQEGAVGEIMGIDGDTVRVDFNHELAGEALEFEIEVVSIEG